MPKSLFPNLIKKYSLTYLLGILSISSLKWVAFVKMGVHIQANNERLIWIIVLCAPAFYLFRDIFNHLNFKKQDRIICCLVLIPASVTIAGMSVANYFIDRSYKIKAVALPSDILKMPDERFFKIEDMTVLPDNYFCVREHHTVNRNGDVEYSNYYLTPVYDDIAHSDTLALSRVGFGVSFHTTLVSRRDILHDSISNWHTIKPEWVDFFNSESETNYNLYNFNDADYFEKVVGSNSSLTYYKAAWDKSRFFDHSVSPVILEKRKGPLQEITKRDLKELLWSVILPYVICVILFWFCDFNKNTEFAGFTLKE